MIRARLLSSLLCWLAVAPAAAAAISSAWADAPSPPAMANLDQRLPALQPAKPDLASPMLHLPPSGGRQAAPSCQESPPRWEYRLTPYIWFSGLDGKVGAGGRTADVNASFSDILSNLNIAAMLAFEARRGKLLLFLDALYLSQSADADTRGPLFSGAAVNSDTLMLDFEVGKLVKQYPCASVTAVAGFRYWNLKNELDLHAGTLPAINLSQRQDWFDPVLGILVRRDLPPRWHASAKLDIGGFGVGSDFTWQIFGALRYDLSKKSGLVMAYRYLSVDYNSSGFVFDAALQGPLLGYQFQF